MLTRQSRAFRIAPRALRAPHDIFPPAHTQFVKRSRCFLHCAVVIKVQCRSIRDCTVTTAPLIVARRAAWLREPNRRPSQRRRRRPRRRDANPLRRRSKAARSIGFETVERLCHTSRRCQRAGGGDATPRSDAGSSRQEGVGETGFKLPRHYCLRDRRRRNPRSTGESRAAWSRDLADALNVSAGRNPRGAVLQGSWKLS